MKLMLACALVSILLGPWNGFASPSRFRTYICWDNSAVILYRICRHSGLSVPGRRAQTRRLAADSILRIQVSGR